MIPETDDSLRARILYVAGDGELLTAHIRHADAKRLEEIAAALRLERRRVERVAADWGRWR
jgi:hypothetical protein